jgi:hypothetical protein
MEQFAANFKKLTIAERKAKLDHHVFASAECPRRGGGIPDVEGVLSGICIVK